MPTLRLLSVDARQFGRDRAALARTIAAAEVDVAAVHNAPHLLRWRSISASIARRSGLVVVTGGRTAAGNLLMSSLGVDVSATRDLRSGNARHPSGAAVAALQRLDARFLLASVALRGSAAEGAAQVGQLRDSLDRLQPEPVPAIVCADGAGSSGSAAWQALARDSAAVAGRIFVDRRIDVADSRELPGGTALLVELDVRTEPGRPGPSTFAAGA